MDVCMFTQLVKVLIVVAIVPVIVLLNGCRVIAQERWMGRSDQEALNLFGRPSAVMKKTGANGEELVVLTWHKSSSWTNTEAAGTSMTHTGNGMVYTEYYNTVGNSSDCTLEATLNKAGKIVDFKIDNGRIVSNKCKNIPYVPGYIPPGF